MTDVHLSIAPTVYARLRTLAHARGESVTDLLSTQAYRLSRLDITADEVGVMWTQGFTDRQISAELGWTNNRTANRRRALGLTANKPQKARSVRTRSK